MYVHFGIFMLI